MDHDAAQVIPEPEDREYHSHTIAQGADIHRLREFNRLLVLNYIREHGPISRAMLSQRLGLSRPTVSSIMDTLLQEGMVREGHLLDATSKGGRRAIQVHFHADAGRVLGIDVGRSHLTLILTNLAAEIVAQRSIGFDTRQGPAICLPLLLKEIQMFVEESAGNWDAIAGMGLGIPGPLSADLHRLSSPPHMPGWDTIDIWEVLHQAFHKPLYVDNDANMGALGESRCGAGRGYQDIAYVKIGTGIGCGLMINGQIYRGHRSSAGELGHLSIDENGPVCVCGNRGCLETLAAAGAIVEDARQGISWRQQRGMAGKQAEDSPALGQFSLVDIADVVAAAQEGHAASRCALERAGERIGLALAGLVNLFNPAAIIIDGGVVRSGDLLLDPLRRVAISASLPAARQGTRLLTGELDNRAIALGAALAVLDAAFALNAPAISTAPMQGTSTMLTSLISRNALLASDQEGKHQRDASLAHGQSQP